MKKAAEAIALEDEKKVRANTSGNNDEARSVRQILQIGESGICALSDLDNEIGIWPNHWDLI